MKAKSVYAVYKGDEFVDVGTIDELSSRLNKKKDFLRWLSYPTAHKRTAYDGNKMLLYKLDNEE